MDERMYIQTCIHADRRHVGACTNGFHLIYIIQTDMQADGHTDIQSGKQIGRQTFIYHVAKNHLPNIVLAVVFCV